MPLTLHKPKQFGANFIHSDILSTTPAALSSKRALKVGRAVQEEMSDPKGPDECILCNPSLRPPNSNPHQTIIGCGELGDLKEGKVGGFVNDFPYLPEDQWVIYMWNDSEDIRKKYLHRFKLKDFDPVEWYWLLRACLEKGRSFERPKESTDTWRMVAGFNLGQLAGQSIPHVHAQYGWEVALNPKTIKRTELALYFEELEEQELIIFQNDKIRLVAPWTPMGQYAVDLYFKKKYEFRQMDDWDNKIFAVFGHAILKKYLQLGIQNVNIVFTNSPLERETEPLVAHFVPRVNIVALYEIKGVNVVDTPPQNIFVEFTAYNPHSNQGILWPEVYDAVSKFDPILAYEQRINMPTGGSSSPSGSTSPSTVENEQKINMTTSSKENKGKKRKK